MGSEFEGKKTWGGLQLVFSVLLASWASWMKGVLPGESVVGTKGIRVWGMRRCQHACSPLALKMMLDPSSELTLLDPVPSLLEGEGVCQEEGT